MIKKVRISQSHKNLVRRSRLRIQRRPGKMQHNDDTRKGCHHNDENGRNGYQRQGQQDTQRAVDFPIPVIHGNGQNIRIRLRIAGKYCH